MNKQEKYYVDWLIENKELIKILELCKRVGIPQSTLRKFVCGEIKTFPEKYIKPLVEELKKLKQC